MPTSMIEIPRRGWVALCLAAVALVAAVVPAAAAETPPHITDIAGDANGVNGQGQNALQGFPGPVSTGPASYSPADLREVGFETLYEAIPVGEDGIDYRATGLAIHIITEATPKSDAHTLVYSLVAGLKGCNSRFKVFLRGPLSAAGDPADRTLRWNQIGGSCPDGPGTELTLTGANVVIDAASRELTISIPVASLTTQQKPYFQPGAVLAGLEGAAYYSGLRVVVSSLTRTTSDVLVPVIDETAPGFPFVIGSDMPADVPCTTGC